ncbi:MAG: tRNA (adenosine(37)-N6)-threonylcarbamoyltransferase complex ATPase subunit type 1 TsaE [Candidatus Niyogibacteria bacterium RIFCSPLOWO2_01_FULL_45_48]|uniref:tRNA threonylcarbamoyladenosine biosynthesis protein TsaE n=2 Tax=Parcubacteria group TaxID=1794811 RepID=A0A1G2R6X9_9BACT|nr:MAG: tRNA (adenosine(37)-N6)-threonylcarbamoyltransferase complex ATPase subunit type 1 TsaE [Candidatus Niyogibacteria bacterium RIFCSPHIGHO2_01_FULL_45_28]OGZ30876.1 MAG: tRNA (adenosine(37)-N6)-threonylcarbamoyltransferase complex ATPase subunit type 1 TsaE [Candidatus Niyogibacteria bacterium RIFCSPLOWO2_01_FULL_45_48]OHA68620.1 MAG: tRNA (adenosine(37)-N6)-threonylcarbamoyltransferase complex ATPase subunit type 1 TsaE [Candidatus Wildermuthbacteria bacterium RIFCSPHIGHO2_02_FULL_47_17]O
MVFETNSGKETKKLGEILARELVKIKTEKTALVLAFSGELGAGKTTFVQGLAKGLGIKEKIKSPTFLIVKNYKLKTKNHKLFIHIDAYRLKKPKDILSLGWREMSGDQKNIIVIEWAKHIAKILPAHHIDISFKHISENKRKIEFRLES